MKKLLSIWSGRLIFLLFSAALVVSFLAPVNVLAMKQISLGWGIGGTEGDPLDTNDYSGSSSGGSQDVNEEIGTDSVSNPLVFKFGRIRILLVPQFLLGNPIFNIIVIDNADLGLSDWSLERTNAP